MRRKHDSRGQRDPIAYSILRSRQAEEQTNAEGQYLANLVRNRTPVLVKLSNGEEISGWIEYYDRSFIRVTRMHQPNAFIYKNQIKYIQEAR
jgi:sRNA-binding regulator protein Hfq